MEGFKMKKTIYAKDIFQQKINVKYLEYFSDMRPLTRFPAKVQRHHRTICMAVALKSKRVRHLESAPLWSLQKKIITELTVIGEMKLQRRCHDRWYFCIFHFNSRSNRLVVIDEPR